jgi:hypothetical protein
VVVERAVQLRYASFTGGAERDDPTARILRMIVLGD